MMTNLMKHKKKGTSLAVVFIISAVILLMLATTFLVVGNYNISVFSRKKELAQKVYPEKYAVDVEGE